MKIFENTSLQSTFTLKYYVPRYIKENSYLNSTTIQIYNTSETLNITKAEAYVPPIENYWGGFSRKYGEKFLKSNHTMPTKQTLKIHVQKINDFFG